MTLIGVKSKYGSGKGTCPGLINFNNTKYVEIHTEFINGNYLYYDMTSC